MYEVQDIFLIEEPIWTIDPTNLPISSISYSNDGNKIVYNNDNSFSIIINSHDGTFLDKISQDYTNNPTIGCYFHPVHDHLLIQATKDGFIFLHNRNSREISHFSRHLGSCIQTLDIDNFGDSFCIGCADGSIRIYDINTFQRSKALVNLTNRSNNQTSNLHEVIYHPEDSNIIFSAVSNDRVLIWDVRTGLSERSISGPHIRGKGISVYDGIVTTASFRDIKTLEMWDFGSGKKIKELSTGTNLNGISISKNGLIMGISSQSLNSFHILEYTNLISIGQPFQIKNNINNIICSPLGSSIIYGTESGNLGCYFIRGRK